MKTASSVAVACVVLPNVSERKRSQTTWSIRLAAPDFRVATTLSARSAKWLFRSTTPASPAT
jgi:hypothetical protein